MPNTSFNTVRTTQMATNNPESNINQINNQVQQPIQNDIGGTQRTVNNVQIPQVQNGQTVNPVTIPIQLQPQIAPIGQQQEINSSQPISNFQVINSNLPQTYNTPTPQQYQGNTQDNNTVDFNQIYDNYKQNYGNDASQSQSSSGVKRTSFGTTIVTPTTDNLNSVEGQYQSAYSDTMNGVIASLLSQLEDLRNGNFGYDPSQDNALRLASEYATNSTLQSLAGSGVLNSSATSERVARIVSELIPQYEQKAYDRQLQYLSQLANTAQLVMNYDSQQFEYWKEAKDREFKNKQFEYQKQQDAITNAWKRVDELGYVDNEASTLLGVPVGTPSWEAKNAKEQREFELQKMKDQLEMERANEEALYRLKSELDLERNKQLAAYENNLDIQRNKELAQFENNLDIQKNKELAQFESDLNLQRSKELASYESQLSREEARNKYELEKEFGTYKSSSSSSSSTNSISTYKDIINNRYADYDENTKKYTTSDNVGLYNYLISEYTAGRLSASDLATLTAMYGVTQPTDKEIAKAERKKWLDSLGS